MHIAIEWKNLHNISLNSPFIYLIVVMSAAGNEYRYIGSASSASRLGEYLVNILKILNKEPRRPLCKQNGDPQSENNLKYRHVHLVLAKAVRKGWQIEWRPIINCSKEELTAQECFYKQKYDCNMNDLGKWFVEDFSEKSANIV